MRALLVASAMSLSACSTTPPSQDLPRPLPIEAMAPCSLQLCMLRPEIVNLELKDQLAMILACKIADAESYRRCEAKQAALSDWVRSR